ncbi:PilZ domain-containing protein [Sphingomonas aliaeris]|uniref:PilZ domain-containing protein n=1 Tax=Sphingomonas aliaeris TaxID=2759526 RepID=A0A974NS77_9SPHN|nr:PilZ domain-containing protein [Sphingomonas aliaeris]QQV75948.1 PilZ domain-containing protein [Sphingomonas aliaeris]
MPAEQINRAARRQKSFQPGTWMNGDQVITLHVLDISESGARAHSPMPPSEGRCVPIVCGLPLGRAVVRWVSASTFGLEFVVPISTDTVAAVLKLTPR